MKNDDRIHRESWKKNHNALFIRKEPPSYCSKLESFPKEIKEFVLYKILNKNKAVYIERDLPEDEIESITLEYIRDTRV